MNKKPVPLLKRLEDALRLSSSDSDVKKVYGRLNDFVNSKIGNGPIDENEFYHNLNSQTLSPHDSDSYSVDEIKQGKRIAQYLSDIVILPEGKSKLLRESRKLRRIEFEAIQTLYSQNE